MEQRPFISNLLFFHMHNSALSTDTEAAWVTYFTVIFSILIEIDIY